MSYRVKVCCPGTTCPKIPLYWSHVACGGDTYMNIEGDMRCGRCGEEHFIQYWCFKCSSVKHGNEYESFTCRSICQAFSTAGEVLSDEGDRAALIEHLLANIMKRWKGK
jgi:hypothetical protein